MAKRETVSTNEGLKWFDWAIFLFFAVVCFFCLQHADLLHTGESSFAYLNGHILDFYDYNAQYFGVNNYLPSTYILFAIWNIPLRLIEGATIPSLYVPTAAVLWYKALPTVVYLLCGYLMYLISMQHNMGQAKSKLCAYAFMAAPIAFFSQFIFGQYDSFTVFFVLLGLYYWGKEDLDRFAIVFGVAMTFKYFALLIFTPLLFLREKKLGRIIRGLILVFLPLVLEAAVYISSEAFRDGVLGFGATSYFMNTKLNTVYCGISIVPVLWICICVCAFFQKPTDRVNEFQWAVYLCSLVFFCFFGLSFWHPQWLIIAIPFLTFGMMIHTRTDIFCLVDLLLVAFFVAFAVNTWPNWADQDLFCRGILGPSVAGKLNRVLTMRQLFIVNDVGLLFTCFSAMLLVAAAFKHPKYLETDYSKLPKYTTAWIRVRSWLGIAIFVVPAFICYFVTLAHQDLLLTHTTAYDSNLVSLCEEYDVEQRMVVDGESISYIDVLIDSNDAPEQGAMKVTVKDADSGSVIAEASKPFTDLTAFECNRFDFTDAVVTPGEDIAICLSAEGAAESASMSVYRTADGTASENDYAQLDDVKQSYCLCIDVWGW